MRLLREGSATEAAVVLVSAPTPTPTAGPEHPLVRPTNTHTVSIRCESANTLTVSIRCESAQTHTIGVRCACMSRISGLGLGCRVWGLECRA